MGVFPKLYEEVDHMLTPKQNMLEVIKGGNPDRFVNQYEAVQLLFHPFMYANPLLQPGQENVVNAWGVTNTFPKGVPGSFPVHTPDKIVVKDIEDWKDYVHAPSLKFTQDQWDMVKAQYDAVDGEQAFKAAFVAPGIFEQTHHLCEISNALVYYITNPDEMHDLIKYLTEWELELAEGICSNLHPDAIFHHDDWGGLDSTFMSPAMFDEFLLEPYKEIYGYYHSHGVELVIHHSDSYAATLVPSMIEMGIDVWQGCMETNNLPELIRVVLRTVQLTSRDGQMRTARQLYVVSVKIVEINTLFLVSLRVVLVLFIREFTNLSVIPLTS